MSNVSLLKVRVWPSLDFSLGGNHPPRKDSSPVTTDVSIDSYSVGYKQIPIYSVDTKEYLIDSVVSAKYPDRLDADRVIGLLEAYEQQYKRAVETGDYAASQSAIAKIEKLALAPSLLGLSVATNSHKSVRKQRGLTGITSYGKRMVRSGCSVLEARYGRECLTLGTCTLPALTNDEFELVCSGWSDLVRKFFQELSRELLRRSLSSDYVQVTEIQERRFNKTGDVGLHLHWLIQGRKHRSDAWAFTPSEVRDLWARILANAVGRDVDCTAATRIEKPKTSCLQELGKYLSKGVTAISAVVSAGKAHLLPSSWWGAAKDLKSQVKAEIIELTGFAALWLDSRLKEMKSDGQLWYVDIWVEHDGHEFRAGAVGRFCDHSHVQELLDARDTFSAID